MAVYIQIGDEFDTFVNFKAHLDQYSKEKNVQFCIADSCTVESANTKLSQNAKQFDARFKYRYVRFRCKHGGKLRTSSKGIRPNQRYDKPFKKVTSSPSKGSYRFQIICHIINLACRI